MTGGGGWVLSLDFGTTATAAAVRANGGPVSELVMPNGGTTVSSSVFAEDDGVLVVGAEADNLAEMGLDAYEPTPKRRVGDKQVPLGESRYTPAELIGAVIASVIDEALRQHNTTPPGQVVMTHPWSWRAPRKRVLREALDNAAARLQLARLPDPAFVAEPVAAARWYAQSEPPPEGAFFAVYDLGGGTFDTAVLRASAEGGYEVLASGGIDPLGGFDFDQLLFDYLGEKHIAEANAELWAGLSSPGQADPDLAHRRRQLQGRVRLLKEALTSQNTKTLRLPGLTSPVVVTRAEYEELIREHVDDTVTELEDTIAEAGLEPAELTAIYRIGGAARTPLVGAALDRLHLQVKTTNHPKLVVAQGAATTATTTRPLPAPPPPPTPPLDPSPKSFDRPTAAPEPSRHGADQPPPPSKPVPPPTKPTPPADEAAALSPTTPSHDVVKQTDTGSDQSAPPHQPGHRKRTFAIRKAGHTPSPVAAGAPRHLAEPAGDAVPPEPAEQRTQPERDAGAHPPVGTLPRTAYASWIRRVVAAIIDVIPMAIILGVGGGILAGTHATSCYREYYYAYNFTRQWHTYCHQQTSSGGKAAMGIAVALTLLYAIWNWGYRQGRKGSTIGKRMLKFQVVREKNGQPIGFFRSIARQFAHIVDSAILYIGYLFPLWDPKRQTLADKIMGTVCLRIALPTNDLPGNELRL